jgi:hypothetical protein
MKAAELAEIYRKVHFYRGDPITDEELNGAIEDMKFHVDFLHELGDRFHHAWWDLHETLRDLVGFKDARKRR